MTVGWLRMAKPSSPGSDRRPLLVWLLVWPLVWPLVFIHHQWSSLTLSTGVTFAQIEDGAIPAEPRARLPYWLGRHRDIYHIAPAISVLLTDVIP